VKNLAKNMAMCQRGSVFEPLLTSFNYFYFTLVRNERKFAITQDPNALGRACVEILSRLPAPLGAVPLSLTYNFLLLGFSQASGGGPRRLTFIQFYSKLTPTHRLVDVCKTYTKST
jgi:hypothetical protein